MALTDPYADVATYRLARGKDDAGEDALILQDLTAISRWLERRFARFFNQEGTDETPVMREFDAYGPVRGYRPFDWAERENPYVWGGFSRSLEIDDLVSATEVLVDEDMDGICERTLGPTEYELYPKNAARGPEPIPYKEIRIPGWSAFGGFQHAQRVQVSGIWGWPTVPVAITTAVIELTALWRLETTRATTEITEFNRTVGTNKAARDILDRVPSVYSRRSPF